MQLLHKGPMSAGSPSGYFQLKEDSIPPSSLPGTGGFGGTG